MAHEELKKQYVEDSKYHENPWRFWEYSDDGIYWHPCGVEPFWTCSRMYRRKEQPFVTEYFSGLNWREALPLVEHVVEFSCDGEVWRGPYVLQDVIGTKHTSHRYRSALCNDYLYIRTCPQTHAHPTITIGGVELPRPEVEKLERKKEYWLWTPTGGVQRSIWWDSACDREWLRMGIIHLTEARAQAWASWWQSEVLSQVTNT